MSLHARAMDEYSAWPRGVFRRAGNGTSMKDFASRLGSCRGENDKPVKAALARLKPEVGALCRRHGPQGQTFHNHIMVRRGFGDAAKRIQEL